MGSVNETAQEVVDDLVAKGEKVGMVRVHLYRPFSAELLVKALPRTVKEIAVLDRDKVTNGLGEGLYQDVISALDLMGKKRIKVIGGRYGLSSKDTHQKEMEILSKSFKSVAERKVIQWQYSKASSSASSYMWLSRHDSTAQIRFEFERTHKDGDAVRHGEEIGTVKVFHGKATVKYEEIFSLKAHSSGVIFYQIDNSPDIGVKAIVAVICDENDTKTEVSKWVQSVLPNYLP